MREHDPTKDGATADKGRTRSRRPAKYRVIFHNDDYTTQEWVVHVLKEFFNKYHVEAAFVMLTVHYSGLATVGVYARDIAETLTEKVTEASRSAGFPLRVTCEPE